MRKLSLFILIFFSLNTIGQTVYYVKADGSDSNDGKSWTKAFATLNKAINAAVKDDEIRVGQGTFNSTATHIIDKSLTIKGSFTSEGIQNYTTKTVLDGKNTYRIMQVKWTGSGLIPNLNIDGFAFKNANSLGFSGAVAFDKTSGYVSNCDFVNNASPVYGGGGLALINSTVKNTVVNCNFNGNTGNDGGAIYCGAGTLVDIINCTIANNSCATGIGGGIYSNGTLNLKNCIIWGNKKETESDQINGTGTFNLDHNIIQGGVVVAPIPDYEDVISENFVGIGAEIGGYDTLNDAKYGSATLNNEDWDQLFSRLTFMRPGLVRIMGSKGWNYSIGGVYNPDKSKDILFKILDFCQTNNINVLWGEWGHTGGTTVDMTWLNQSISFLDYLVNTKKYSCIKYFTMLNEPQGSWSSNGGSYSLWKDLMNKTYTVMLEKALLGKVQICAPDVSIARSEFTGSSTVSNGFVTSTISDLNNKIGTYCYHLYPTPECVEDGKFYNSMKAYKNIIPANKDALITEIGFVYTVGTVKGDVNEALKAADPYAESNANMMVYESSYGIDISVSIIQLLLSGYKAAVVWRMDDAMYLKVGTKGVTLTRWGFWNSVGKELMNNTEDEKLRPWFFPTSLLAKYFPTGSTVLKVITGYQDGLFAVAAKKGGKYTIALVNSSSQKHTFSLKMAGGQLFSTMKKYEYIALTGKNFTGVVDANGFPVPSQTQDIDLANNKLVPMEMEANSFVLLTNME